MILFILYKSRHWRASEVWKLDFIKFQSGKLWKYIFLISHQKLSIKLILKAKKIWTWKVRRTKSYLTNEFYLFSLFENTSYFTHAWKNGWHMPTYVCCFLRPLSALIFKKIKSHAAACSLWLKSGSNFHSSAWKYPIYKLLY